MTAIEQPLIKTIYDLFDLVRTRPKMYLGNNGQTLTTLIAFANGYDFACLHNEVNIDEATEYIEIVLNVRNRRAILEPCDDDSPQP